MYDEWRQNRAKQQQGCPLLRCRAGAADKQPVRSAFYPSTSGSGWRRTPMAAWPYKSPRRALREALPCMGWGEAAVHQEHDGTPAAL